MCGAVVGLVLLPACSTGHDTAVDEENPLEPACRVVEEHAARGVAQDDAAALRSFARRLADEAGTLSSSDAAELRPLAGAASAVAQAPAGADSDQAYADYLTVLDATSDVCEAARAASR